MPFWHLIHFKIYMIEALIVGQLTSVISIVYQFSSTQQVKQSVCWLYCYVLRFLVIKVSEEEDYNIQYILYKEYWPLLNVFFRRACETIIEYCWHMFGVILLVWKYQSLYHFFFFFILEVNIIYYNLLLLQLLHRDS